MKTLKIGYRVSVVLFSLIMLYMVYNFLFNTDEVVATFQLLGFPSFVVVPLGLAKLLGVLAIVSNVSHRLKVWAGLGFFFNFSAAIYAHLRAGDGMLMMPAAAMVLLAGIFFLEKKNYWSITLMLIAIARRKGTSNSIKSV